MSRECLSDGDRLRRLLSPNGSARPTGYGHSIRSRAGVEEAAAPSAINQNLIWHIALGEGVFRRINRVPVAQAVQAQVGDVHSSRDALEPIGEDVGRSGTLPPDIHLTEAI
jgi:hypothetical protein